MELKRITPEEAGISSGQIIKFLDALKKEGLEIHSMMLLRHGNIFAESWWKPYNKYSKHIMFSFTKSLTSTAIGFAAQEGLLSIDDYILDIFPEKAPQNPSENLKKCQLKHILMMGCGHESEIPRLGMGDKGWIDSFLHHPFVYEPGTHFLYNTAGTNILCAVLKEKTGLNLIEFLKPRLLEKIGMGEVPCYSLPDGTEMGGAGSRLTTEQMARFIQFVANKGTWNGERLLNSEWFDIATSKQIDNKASSDIPDWQQGYCFQFWRCARDGVFRADGAFGQFGVVCPNEDAVFIFTTSSTNFHKTLQVIWDNILPNFSESPLPENKDGNLLLNYILEHNEITPMLSARQPMSEKKYSGKKYAAGIDGNWADFIGGAGISSKGTLDHIAPKNCNGKITEISVDFKPYEATLAAKIGDEYEVLPISMTSHFNSFELSDKVYGAVGAWRTPDTFEFVVHCAEAATGKRIYLTFSENALKISAISTIPDFGGLNDEKEDDLILAEI